MWSGAPQWASWALQSQNPQALKPEEVDWAALAKQWIQMKETQEQHQPQQQQQQQQLATPGGSSSSNGAEIGSSTGSGGERFPQNVAPAPPGMEGGGPPAGGTATAGGEMDMEIEDDKDGTDQQQNGEAWANWSSQAWPQAAMDMGGSWGWGWPGMDPSGMSMGPDGISGSQGKDDSYGWMLGGPTDGEAGSGDFRHRRDMRDRRGREFYGGTTADGVRMQEKEADFQLDAAQRRKLPLWIREGLEKMEREKQKKLERERQMSEKEEMLRRRREEEARARQILQEDLANDGIPRVPRKSKFDSDSDASDHSRSSSPEAPVSSAALGRKRQSRFAPPDMYGNVQSVKETEEEEEAEVEEEESEEEARPVLNKETKASSPEPPTKSAEEKMKEMMLKLRRWMTEILLDVTTDMMYDVATEVHNRARMKAPAVQVKKTSALASLSGGLGLSIYSDSDDSEGEGGDGGHDDDDGDSDEELRETIRRKRRDFQSTERSILQRLQSEEMAERRRQDVQTSDSESEIDEVKVPPVEGSRDEVEGSSDVGKPQGAGSRQVLSEDRTEDTGHRESQGGTPVKPVKFVPPQESEDQSSQANGSSENGSAQDGTDSKGSGESADSEEDSHSSLSEVSHSSDDHRARRRRSKKEKRKSSRRYRVSEERERKRRRSRSGSRTSDRRGRDDRKERKKKRKRKDFSHSRSRSLDRYSGSKYRSRSRSRSHDSRRSHSYERSHRHRDGSQSDSDDGYRRDKHYRDASEESRPRHSRSRERRHRDGSSESRSRRSRSKDRRHRDNRSESKCRRSRSRESRMSRCRSRESRRRYRDDSGERRSRDRGEGRRGYRNGSIESRSERNRKRSRSHSRSRSRSRDYVRKYGRDRSRSRTPKKSKRRRHSRSMSSSRQKKSRRRSRSSS